MDIKALAENLGLEESEYREMLEIFFESAEQDLAKIEAALNDGNAEQTHEASHSLKGSSGSLGLTALFDLAQEIDDTARQGKLDGLREKTEQLRSGLEALKQGLS